MANKILSLGKSLRDRAGGLMPRAAARLGLSALIPFAVAGCGIIPSSEAKPIRYSTVFLVIENGGDGAEQAKGALRDGKLTNSEYDRIMDIRRSFRERQYEAEKQRKIRQYLEVGHGE